MIPEKEQVMNEDEEIKALFKKKRGLNTDYLFQF